MKLPSERSLASLFVLAALLPAPVGAQDPVTVRLSIGWRGPSIGMDGISAGDLLRAPLESVAGAAVLRDLSATQLGLVPIAGCTPRPGTPCGVDVDALSLGQDRPLPEGDDESLALTFAVDRHARGVQGTALSAEAAGDEQGADIYSVRWRGLAHYALGGGVETELMLDGDGVASAALGHRRVALTGLSEPNLPQRAWPFESSDTGDQVDALDVGGASAETVYLSLAGGLPDPLDPSWAPHAASSAARHGFVGGDVLRTHLGGSPVVYASAERLGLDLAGADTDDLDALVLWDDGDGLFEPALEAYGWGAQGDMLAFSVRRGSAVIGSPDSRLGLRIVPGDLLIAPENVGQTPRILVRAEALGLWADRSPAGGDSSDDMTAVDDDEVPFRDCNHNLVPDHLDIVYTTSYDNNMNGIPDECEIEIDSFCGCPNGATSACNNGTPHAGCANATGAGGTLVLVGAADASDTFTLVAGSLNPTVTTALFVSATSTPPTVAGNGLLCLGSPSVAAALQTSDGLGRVEYGPGVLAEMQSLGLSVPTAGETRLFQVWYRDVGGPCGGDANLTLAGVIQF